MEIKTLTSKPVDDSNHVFRLAADLVENTGRSVFLTGNAGTGKTTFLRHIKSTTRKKIAIVAPTGVAAINAGGMTIHSFFQIPPGTISPEAGWRNDASVLDIHRILRDHRMNKEKRRVLEKLELLIIDEISMVRADLLDAVDGVLRHYKHRRDEPFGGVQVLFIGDLHQLSPVVRGNEEDILKQFYEGPFFFHSRVITQHPPLYIELKKIYRQTDQRFIDLLNRVRHCRTSEDDFDLLRERFQPEFEPPKSDPYIVLTTHNAKADAVNDRELDKLKTKQHRFRAFIEGDFSEKAFPADLDLLLKEGAQIMFIRNDTLMNKFFNGKLAEVKSIEGEKITVSFFNGDDDLELKRMEWENIRYSFNSATNSLDEEVLGSFRQFPVRLAWAITIHKSQGLTFDKAIIDAGASFAPGQVYVALSRCTSLSGIVLHSPIYPSSIQTDPHVIAFSASEDEAAQLSQILLQEKRNYTTRALMNDFDFADLVSDLREWNEFVPQKKIPDPKTAIALSEEMLRAAETLNTTAEKFRQQLKTILESPDDQWVEMQLKERVSKAVDYFIRELGEKILRPLQFHLVMMENEKKIKLYLREAMLLSKTILERMTRFTTVHYGGNIIGSGKIFLDEWLMQNPPPVFEEKKKKPREEKGATQKRSFEMFKSGMSVQEISAARQLAPVTIEGHLAQFVRTGELEINEIVPQEKLLEILSAIKETGATQSTPLKEKLGDNFSYGEIRAALNYWQRVQEEQVS